MYQLSEEQCERVVNNAARHLYRYCRKTGLHYLVTGSSGGRDSAITLGLAQRAHKMAAKDRYSLTSVGVVLPCASAKKFTKLGEQAVEAFDAYLIYKDLTLVYKYLGNLGLLTKTVDEYVYDVLYKNNDQAGLDNFKKSEKIAQGNIKARLRMMTLYHIARRLGSAMVLSTDNLSEYWMGFWTINGDVGDYGMIQNILKGIELEDIARYLGVPESILAVKPDDGLGITNMGDAGQLGAEYPELDRIMVKLIQHGFDPDGSWKQLDNLPDISATPQLAKSLAARALGTAFKRRGPIKLTRRQLGLPKIKDIDLD